MSVGVKKFRDVKVFSKILAYHALYNLTPSEVLVFIALLSNQEEWNPSVIEIAAKINRTPRQVVRALKKLQEYEIIELIKPAGGKRNNTWGIIQVSESFLKAFQREWQSSVQRLCGVSENFTTRDEEENE